MAEGGALRELVARFSADIDVKSLGAFEAGISNVFVRLQKFAGVLAGLFALNQLKEFVGETIESAVALKKLAGATLVSTDEFQKVQGYLKASADETAMAIQRMNRGIGAAKGGEKSPVERLGVSLKDAQGQLKPTSELILDISDKIHDLKTPAEQTAAVFDIFGRGAAGLIKPMSAGRKEAVKLYKEFESLGGVVDKDFIEKSHKAEKEMKQFKIVMGALKRDAVSALLPTVLQVAEAFKRGAVTVRNFFKNTNAIEHFFKVLQFGTVIAGIYKLISAVRALTVATFTNPWVLLIAGALALFLIIDDLWTLLEGGDSLIGDALGPDKEAFVLALKTSFDALKVSIDAINTALAPVAESVRSLALDRFVNSLHDTFNGITVLVDWANRFYEIINKINTEGISILPGNKKGFNISDAIAGNPTVQAGGGNFKTVGEGGQKAVASVPMKQDNSIKIDNRNTIHVQVEHSSDDEHETVGKKIGQGARSELDKVNVNAINAGKRR